MKLQNMKIETYDNGYVVEGHERSGETLAYGGRYGYRWHSQVRGYFI